MFSFLQSASRHLEKSHTGDQDLLSRQDALSLFLRLQGRGEFPCMVEEQVGRYRVFVDQPPAQRLVPQRIQIG